MRWFLTVLALMGLLSARSAFADDKPAQPRAILEKAIQAHGGKEVLNRYKGIVLKSRGRFFGRERPIDYTATSSFQAPDHLRMEAEGRSQNTVLRVVRVVNSTQGWRVVDGKEEVMNREQLAEAREQMHLTLATRFVPLLERGYRLSVLDAIQVDRRPAVGLRVQHEGFRDIHLYFDKEDGLLRVTRVRVKDVYGTNKESLAQTIYSQYRKVKGMEIAFKVVTHYDNEPYIEYEVTEALPIERLDDRLFRRP